MREIEIGGTKYKYGTYVFTEGEKCQSPNNGTDSSDDVLLRRNGTRCGPDSIEDIQR